MKKGISVIVCCYNSATRLPDTLGHLLKQKTNGFDWEIIVVDNASTDNTSQLSGQLFSEKLPKENFKVVREETPGLSNARRKGYLTSQYQYLLFCDDDNWMQEDYLQLAFTTMKEKPAIGILGGIGTAVFEKEKPFWFDKYQINFAVGEQSDVPGPIAKADMVYGAGFIVRREIFEKLDAINFESLLSDRKSGQLMSGGDTELCLVAGYLGYEVCVSRQLKFKHLMPPGRMNWDYLKKLYYGFGRSRVYVQAYKQMENRAEIPGLNLRLPLWLDKYLHRLKDLKYYLPRALFQQNEEGNDTVLKYFALKGELFELWSLKSQYAEVFKKILAMKSRIASLRS
jgi:glycosyltransferase involved in cell wall biosynthesis